MVDDSITESPTHAKTALTKAHAERRKREGGPNRSGPRHLEDQPAYM
jgi:hypothetical protein